MKSKAGLLKNSFNCCVHDKNKNADERLLSYFEFSFENETSAYITLHYITSCNITRQESLCTHLISNSPQKHKKSKMWSSGQVVSTSRTSRAVPVEAVVAVSHLQEGRTDFLITSTGSWRFANWAKGKHLLPTSGQSSRLCLGDKIKVERAQQSQKEVLMRSLSQ